MIKKIRSRVSQKEYPKNTLYCNSSKLDLIFIKLYGIDYKSFWKDNYMYFKNINYLGYLNLKDGLGITIEIKFKFRTIKEDWILFLKDILINEVQARQLSI